jgi:hypothetical protein
LFFLLFQGDRGRLPKRRETPSEAAIKVARPSSVAPGIFAPGTLGRTQKVLSERLVFRYRLSKAAECSGQDSGLLGIHSDAVDRLFQAPSDVSRSLLLSHSFLLPGL